MTHLLSRPLVIVPPDRGCSKTCSNPPPVVSPPDCGCSKRSSVLRPGLVGIDAWTVPRSSSHPALQLWSLHGEELPHNFCFSCLYLYRPVDELKELFACTWLTGGATSRRTAAGIVPADEHEQAVAQEEIVRHEGSCCDSGTLSLKPKASLRIWPLPSSSNTGGVGVAPASVDQFLASCPAGQSSNSSRISSHVFAPPTSSANERTSRVPQSGHS